MHKQLNHKHLNKDHNKDHIVWYLPGSGGMFVAWLIQTAIDANNITPALQSFPYILKYNPSKWKYYEQIPPNIGVLCNMLIPSDLWDSNTEIIDEYINNTLQSISDGKVSIPISVKYYFINYIWHKTYFYENHEKGLINSTQFKKLANLEFISAISSDINLKKIIFVHTPSKYTKLWADYKHTTTNLNINDSFNTHIANYTDNIFYMSSIFDNTYIDVLERILSKKLSNNQVLACQLLVDRYINISLEIKYEF